MLLLFLTHTLLCLTGGGLCATNKILEPLREEGEEAAVIIMAGADLYHDQYEALGEVIQETSEQRLWVCLTDNNLGRSRENSPQVQQVQSSNDTYLGQCITELHGAGLPESAAVVAYGHSYGAVQITAEVTLYPDLIDGAVFLGAVVLSNQFSSFPVPVLTANGELDGQTRITQHMLAFQSVQDNVEAGDGTYMLYFPHAVLYGVNHCEYITGNIPDFVLRYWINSDVSGDESRQIVADVTLPFVVYVTSSDVTAVAEAEEQLRHYYNETDTFMEPLNEAFIAEEDVSHATSPWANYAQHLLANLHDDYRNLLFVNESVVPESALPDVQPNLSNDTDFVTSTTYTSVHRPVPPKAGLYQGAFMLETKQKSSQAIHEAVVGDNNIPEPDVFCREVNMAAFDWVWNDLAPEVQRERYIARNISVDFLDDVITTSELQWLRADLVFDFNGEHLSVQSSNYMTESDAESLPGMHHCKLLSPAKALEFIYVDALYENLYS